jgi:vacuolar-type H+-ATPase catalytic subunit A/Vma1
MYCSPAKQLWMLRLLVEFGKRARNIVKAGGTLADLREVPALDRLNRMKSEIENTDTAAMASLEQTLLRQLDVLERKLKS